MPIDAAAGNSATNDSTTPAVNFADRLLAAIDRLGTPSVVALDPVLEQLPPAITRDHSDPLVATEHFSRRVIETIAPIVPAVKINIAYFERYGPQGVALYQRLIAEARSAGLLVIGDIKRGDVAHTAIMYAAAHLGSEPRRVGTAHQENAPAQSAGGQGSSLAVARQSKHEPGVQGSSLAHPHATTHPDAITISGYFGLDGVQPFIDAAAKSGAGLFVLVRTSNPSAAAIQDIRLQDGRAFHELMADQVATWSRDPATIGGSGFSLIGAVVATRNAADAARLRTLMPQSIFLIPGYGAQGGTAEDFRPYFTRSATNASAPNTPGSSPSVGVTPARGAIIAAGRSVIFAHREKKYANASPDSWADCVAESCKAFANDVASLIR